MKSLLQLSLLMLAMSCSDTDDGTTAPPDADVAQPDTEPNMDLGPSDMPDVSDSEPDIQPDVAEPDADVSGIDTPEPPVCGDGTVQVGEDCEPGDTRGCTTSCGTPATQSCTPDCAWTSCVAASAHPGMADFWAGTARWEFQRKMTLASTGWPYGFAAGVHIEIHEGVWYLFTRKVHWGLQPPHCDFIHDALGTEVRSSTDGGVTWSQPVPVVAPTEGTAWECMGTDGDIHFDAPTQTWHYLFQCLGRDRKWSGCHVQRQAPDPMGAFSEVHPNPVVRAKDLWRPICNDPDDDCVRMAGGINKVYDEGTFDIFAWDGTYYWVHFHGYDGVRGYRGVAKTRDFVTWVSGDQGQGLPDDAIFDPGDAASWREDWQGGSIGGGAARMFVEGDYHYLLVEAADKNLGCTAGQRWDFGLPRSADLTATTWEQLPAGNPVVYSSLAPERDDLPLPCNVQYAGFFHDQDQQLILHYTRESTDHDYSGIYFYRLVPDHNLLRDGELQSCSSSAWTAFPIGPTNLVVYRHPNNSPDGTCYLATNCGAQTCQPGQSLYQDVVVDALADRPMRFGGSFRTDAGAGHLNLVIHELDEQMAVVATHEIAVDATGAWQHVEGQFVMDPRTVTARYQLYLTTPNTFRADQLRLEPADGCR